MIRKVLWLGVPVALGAAIIGGWTDILRFAKIKQISVGTGHPEAVPAEGRRSYPQSRGQHSAGRHRGLRLSAPRRPGALSGALIRRRRCRAAEMTYAPGSRKAGALVADGRGRDASSGMARGATTVDSRTALVERATHAEPLSCSRVC